MINNITKFSPEVCEKIKSYVYRLIDPRNGQTFYVGKGKGNRVFDHVNGALKCSEEDSEMNNPKISTIRDIKNAGLEVIHVIQCWNLTDEEAFLVESAIMDCYPHLTNIQKGHYSDYGVTNAYTLEKNMSVKTYEEPENIDYIIIKTSADRVRQYQEDEDYDYAMALYEATRSAWRLSLNNVKGKYVLSVIGGIVQEVYEPIEWMQVTNSRRIEFEGKVAPHEIRDYFINKRIPEKYFGAGMANPALYKK